VTLSDKLQADLTAAIRARDEARRDALRMAISAVYNASKAAGRPLADDEVVAVLGREVKARRESIEAYAAAGRDSAVAHEEAALAVIGDYLPAQLDEAELAAEISRAIDETGATSAREIGRVMAAVMPRVKGRADGRQVSEAVARELARRDVASHDQTGHDGGEAA
jgi:uncharacterized protein